jgi:hypothetical protein
VFNQLKSLLRRKLTPFLHFVGIDRAILFTLINRGWSVVAGPVSLLLVVRYLSPAEQGFFYTFSSLLALQIFLELGLAFVLMQCVSHEMAHLSWTDRGTVEGDPQAKARLASIFRFALQWYGAVAALVVAGLIPAGLFFFSSNEPAGAAIVWRLPWICVVVVSGLSVLLTPFYGILEGCGKVSEFARVGARQAIVGSICFWLALIGGARLFASPIVGLVGIALGSTWVFAKHWPFFQDLWITTIPQGGAIRWREEILPFQWKVALSWLSGYFIFHLANPILFHFRGAVEAGQLGMSMRLIDSLTGLAYSWVSTKAAPFGTYIAARDFATLDRVFRRATWQAGGVLVFGACSLLCLYGALHYFRSPFINRLVDPWTLSFLLANALLNCMIFCQATYLRAHKQEPLLLMSVTVALLVSSVTFITGSSLGSLGIASGYFAIHLLVALPWVVVVFRRRRAEWH